MRRLQPVDGLRAVACLLVALYHSFQFTGLAASEVPPPLRQFARNGAAGVDIFIVLSGFCLFLAVARRPEQFRTPEFVRRRVRRIVPAYYAAIVFAIALPFVLKAVYELAGRPTHREALPGVWQVVSHLFFLHMFSTSTWDGINGSFWSLALEAQFYVLFPLIALAFRRSGVRALVAVIVTGVCAQAVMLAVWGQDDPFTPAHFLWSASVLGRFAEFGAGMLAAWFVVTHGEATNRTRQVAATAAVGALLWLVGEAVFPGALLTHTTVWAALVGLILLGAQDHSALSRALSWRPLVIVGEVSYSVYLLHQPTLYYASELAREIGLHGWAIWLFEATFGAAALAALVVVSYRFFELPFLTRRDVRMRSTSAAK